MTRSARPLRVRAACWRCVRASASFKIFDYLISLAVASRLASEPVLRPSIQLCPASGLVSPTAAATPVGVAELEVFVRPGRPYCAEAKRFLSDLQKAQWSC